ncbi:hypothetical protein TNCV_4883731 [Trichonephila clavipes]|nr:hypothetical protein TNCV_4883731 [Trichonephila clavipes]
MHARDDFIDVSPYFLRANCWPPSAGNTNSLERNHRLCELWLPVKQRIGGASVDNILTVRCVTVTANTAALPQAATTAPSIRPVT